MIRNVMDDRSIDPDEQQAQQPRVIDGDHNPIAARAASFAFGGPTAPPPTPVAPTSAPAAPVTGVTGRKDDSGKLDVSLFFNDLPHAIYAVTEVLQWGITKKQPVPYVRGSWQHVPQFQQRYGAAQLRHELNRAIAKIEGQTDEPTDAETSLLELQHIATDALFRLEMAMRKAKGLPVPEGA